MTYPPMEPQGPPHQPIPSAAPPSPPPVPPSWPATLEQPLPGAPRADDFRSPERTRGPGRLTLLLGALALIAVGVLVGVLLRGSSAGATQTPAAAANGRAGSGYGFPNGGGTGQGRAFPGGGAGTQGTISSVAPDGFVMTTSSGSTVTVKIGPTTTVDISVTGASSGALAAGQQVLVVGTESQGTIQATAVREGAVARLGGQGGGGNRTGGAPRTGGNA